MNHSLSRNPNHQNYCCFWSTRIKQKAKRLKKKLGIKQFEALNMLANCWGYKTWKDLKKMEERSWCDYFPSPLNLGYDDKKEFRRKYKIPRIAYDYFKFEPPNHRHFHIGFIKDYLDSSSRNAILPVYKKKEVLFRKFLNTEYVIKGKKIKGNFLYIEQHRGRLGKKNTKLLIKMLREIWKFYPELKIHFSYHGIAKSSPYGNRDNDIFFKKRDWVDWSILPVVKYYHRYTLADRKIEYFDYLILKPF